MVRFVRNTQYNKNEVIDKAMQGCTVGLSRMKFLACNHYSPLEAISILEFETENGIDELFIPLATAYTQSGEEAQQGEKGEVGEGRPKNADLINSKRKCSLENSLILTFNRFDNTELDN